MITVDKGYRGIYSGQGIGISNDMKKLPHTINQLEPGYRWNWNLRMEIGRKPSGVIEPILGTTKTVRNQIIRGNWIESSSL